MDRLFGLNPDLISVQENAAAALRQAGGLLRNAVLLTGVALLTGQANDVSHQLCRDAQGFLVVDQSAQADVWGGASLSLHPEVILRLYASANVTVSLVVF